LRSKLRGIRPTAIEPGGEIVPHKDIEADDPMELVGVMLPADEEAMREMAYVFAEEFARLGHSREQILGLFKNPFYAGAHGAFRALGEQSIQAIVDECIAAWGKVKFSILDFGFSIEEGGEESKIGSAKKKG
jgi:hypothetical protein